MRATPFFMPADADRQLFAIVNGCHPESSTRCGVILCNAFAEERQKTYRATYHFAKMLTERGIPSFRFDYLGTGDSDGDMQDVSLDGMLENTIAAAGRARTELDCDTLVFLGIRLGAVIAARAASALPWADTVIMWNPVVRGSDYFRELQRVQKLIRLARLRGNPPPIAPPDDPDLTVIQADLATSGLISQIQAIDLAAEPLDFSRLLVTGRQDDKKEIASIKSFVEAASASGTNVATWLEQPREYWSTDSMYDAYFPVPTFDRTLKWLDAFLGKQVNG